MSAVAIAKKIAPYLIAALALGWVLRHIDHKKLLTVLHQAPMGAFIAMSALMLVAQLRRRHLRHVRVFGWFGCRVTYHDLFIVRGVDLPARGGQLPRRAGGHRRVPLSRPAGCRSCAPAAGSCSSSASTSAPCSCWPRRARRAPRAAERLALDAARVRRSAWSSTPALLVLKPRIFAERRCSPAVRDGHHRARQGRAGAAAAHRRASPVALRVAAHVRLRRSRRARRCSTCRPTSRSRRCRSTSTGSAWRSWWRWPSSRRSPPSRRAPRRRRGPEGGGHRPTAWRRRASRSCFRSSSASFCLQLGDGARRSSREVGRTGGGGGAS